MGEYLLVIKIMQTLTVGWCRICKQHQYPSSNTKAGLYVVITWNTHGDDGPPFKGQDIPNFGKYLGFKQERKPPKKPHANAEAEQFMLMLKKLYSICQITG